MTSPKLSGTGKLRWSDEHRLALHLLKSAFRLDPNDEVVVFSQIFDLSDISKGKLTSQYGERTREGKGHLWQFLQASSPTERRNQQAMRERIVQAIHELGIDELDEVSLQRLSLSTPSRPKRSRSSPALRGTSGLDEDGDYTPPKRKRRGGETSMVPENDTVQSSVTSINTPIKPRTSKTPKRSSVAESNTQLEVYSRPLGDLNLTPEKIARAKAPPQWPNIQAPRPALVFRYSIVCGDNCGPSCLHKTGYFVARRFRSTFGMLEAPSAPTKENPGSFWNDICIHLDTRPHDTPFVSVSSSLAWTLQQAMKKTRGQDRKVQISLIAIQHDTPVYYAAQPRSEIARKHLFTKGHWRYQASSEWLVYYTCKPFLTIDLADILSHPAASQALRMTELAGLGGYQMDQRENITPALARAFAEIATDLFKFTYMTPAPLYQDLITTIIEGWGLTSSRSEQALECAQEFEHAVTRKSAGAVSVETKEMLKMAFITGIKFGMADRAATHNPVRFRQIEKRSLEFGLSSPARMLTDKFDAARTCLERYELTRYEILQRGKSGKLLSPARAELAIDNDENDEEIQNELEEEEDMG